MIIMILIAMILIKIFTFSYIHTVTQMKLNLHERLFIS